MGQIRHVGEVQGREVKKPGGEDTGHISHLRSDGGAVGNRGNGGATATMAPFGQVPEVGVGINEESFEPCGLGALDGSV